MDRELPAGTVLSYSAGRRTLDAESYRIVEQSDERLSDVINAFPHLAQLFEGKPPILISCYPATIVRSLPGAIFVDTYLRSANVSRALLLASSRRHAAVMIGQPLPVLEFLWRHVQQELPLPGCLAIVTGGYICPRSLETALTALLEDAGARPVFLHGYGMAEVAVGCLMGDSRNTDGNVIYRPVLKSVQPTIENGRLSLRITEGPQTDQTYDTGDFATPHDGGWLIHNAPERLNPILLDTFNRWGVSEWKRRTGYVTRSEAGYRFQLRHGTEPLTVDEFTFGQLPQQDPGPWSEKPDWH